LSISIFKGCIPSRGFDGELLTWLLGAMGEVNKSDPAEMCFGAVGLSTSFLSSDERAGPLAAGSEIPTILLGREVD
jgi:hypothetical protein